MLYFHGKVFTSSSGLLLCFSLFFFPMVCFQTGFQIGRVSSVQDYSDSNRPSASLGAFLVYVDFLFPWLWLLRGRTLGSKECGGNLLVCKCSRRGPFLFLTTQKPGNWEFTRVLWCNAMLLSQPFKFLLASGWGGGTNRVGFWSFSVDALKHSKKHVVFKFPMISWSIGSLEIVPLYYL